MIKNFEEKYPKIDIDLTLQYTGKELLDEFFYYVESKGKLTLNQWKNKIVHYFQQDNFYIVEKQMWKDDSIKEKIINNRIKYLNKTPEELTTYDILSGFKKSAIHYGYSGFNPLLAKWFYEKYNINTCYDPCGGWGNRMLGSTELDLYIYNDLSKSVYEAVNNIKDYFDMYNVVTYCNDAAVFIPEEDYEAMFTCPPYFNIESYECGDFESEQAFIDFLDGMFNAFYKKDSCKTFGMVMREDLLYNHDNYTEKFLLKKNNASHLHKNGISKDEYLYIYKK